MKKYFILMLAIAAIAASCTPQTPATKTVPVTVALFFDGNIFKRADIIVNMRASNGSASYSAHTSDEGIAEFELPAGIYEASVSYKETVDGEVLLYNGVNSSVIVKESGNDYYVELTVSKSSQLIIKELYTGGCAKDDGSGAYLNDKYVILYNNSDTPVDASDIGFGFLSPYNSSTTSKYLQDGVLSYASQGWLPLSNGEWWFETTVTIEPYSQIVIAINGAIDHSAVENYSASVDLSNADYCMYDPESGYNNKSAYPAPSASIPTSNYLAAYRQGLGNAWAVSISSPAFVIFKKDNIGSFVSDITNYDYTEGDKFPNVKVQNDWIVDGIEVFEAAKQDENAKRLTSDIDAGSVLFTNKLGHTLYRNVDKEATEAIADNYGKLIYYYGGGTENEEGGSTDPSEIDAEASIANGAKIVYMDTNNSTNDFHQRKTASLKK